MTSEGGAASSSSTVPEHHLSFRSAPTHIPSRKNLHGSLSVGPLTVAAVRPATPGKPLVTLPFALGHPSESPSRPVKYEVEQGQNTAEMIAIIPAQEMSSKLRGIHDQVEKRNGNL